MVARVSPRVPSPWPSPPSLRPREPSGLSTPAVLHSGDIFGSPQGPLCPLGSHLLQLLLPRSPSHVPRSPFPGDLIPCVPSAPSCHSRGPSPLWVPTRSPPGLSQPSGVPCPPGAPDAHLWPGAAPGRRPGAPGRTRPPWGHGDLGGRLWRGREERGCHPRPRAPVPSPSAMSPQADSPGGSIVTTPRSHFPGPCARVLIPVPLPVPVSGHPQRCHRSGVPLPGDSRAWVSLPVSPTWAALPGVLPQDPRVLSLSPVHVPRVSLSLPEGLTSRCQAGTAHCGTVVSPSCPRRVARELSPRPPHESHSCLPLMPLAPH